MELLQREYSRPQGNLITFGHPHMTKAIITTGNFNANSQLEIKVCAATNLGVQLSMSDEKVQNDFSDSGFGLPTYWAFDYFTRHIQVWPTGTWNVD